MTSKRHFKGAVAAGHRLTAESAANILREGGNVFDAAIAGLWTSCVVEPVLSSIGGGGFFMARDAGGTARLFDFFVQTPGRYLPSDDIELASVLADFGTATQEFHIGAGASATPGFVPGLFAVHARLGRLPMTRLTEQAVEIAKTGFEITPFQAFLLNVVAPIYQWSDPVRALFSKYGALPKAGSTFHNHDLGGAIDAIGREGVRIATEGEIARAMQTSVDAGCLGMDDFARYRVEDRAPLRAELVGHGLLLNPPPSCGGTLVGDMIARLGDEDHGPDIVTYARAIAATDAKWRDAKCNIGTFCEDQQLARHRTATRGTTHISVVDLEGNAAAVTVSNGEGNGHLVPGCGFMVNNMLGEEDLSPDGLHAWQEDIRMASMMAPTICYNGTRSVTALGSGGSNRIRSAVFQVLCRLFREKLPAEEAVAASRVHVERGHLDFEDTGSDEAKAKLQSAFPDHRLWAEPNLFFGGAHLVHLDRDSGIETAGDPRRGGVAVIV